MEGIGSGTGDVATGSLGAPMGASGVGIGRRLLGVLRAAGTAVGARADGAARVAAGAGNTIVGVALAAGVGV